MSNNPISRPGEYDLATGQRLQPYPTPANPDSAWHMQLRQAADNGDQRAAVTIAEFGKARREADMARRLNNAGAVERAKAKEFRRRADELRMGAGFNPAVKQEMEQFERWADDSEAEAARMVEAAKHDGKRLAPTYFVDTDGVTVV